LSQQLTLENKPLEDVKPYRWVTLQEQKEFVDFLKKFGSAGDVNNDGLDDVIVGVSNSDAGQTDAGEVFVFRGQNISSFGTSTVTVTPSPLKTPEPTRTAIPIDTPEPKG